MARLRRGAEGRATRRYADSVAAPLKKASKSEEALATVASNKGKVLMDRARDVLARMFAEEQRLLATREISAQQAYSMVFLLVSLGAFANMVLLASTPEQARVEPEVEGHRLRRVLRPRASWWSGLTGAST